MYCSTVVRPGESRPLEVITEALARITNFREADIGFKKDHSLLIVISGTSKAARKRARENEGVRFLGGVTRLGATVKIHLDRGIVPPQKLLLWPPLIEALVSVLVGGAAGVMFGAHEFLSLGFHSKTVLTDPRGEDILSVLTSAGKPVSTCWFIGDESDPRLIVLDKNRVTIQSVDDARARKPPTSIGEIEGFSKDPRILMGLGGGWFLGADSSGELFILAVSNEFAVSIAELGKMCHRWTQFFDKPDNETPVRIVEKLGDVLSFKKLAPPPR